jgi:hypothetical protein
MWRFLSFEETVMAVSRLNLFFEMPQTTHQDPKLLAAWIERKVPCFVGGNVPAEWTDRVINDLRQVGVPDKMIGAALGVLLAKGVRFAPIMSSDSLGPPRTPQTSMGPRSHERWNPVMAKQKIAQLDLAYHKAQTAGDGEATARALAALLNFAIEVVSARGEMGQEQKKLEEARQEILRNAPYAAKTMRHLGPLELARLRAPMPTPNNPNNLRFRLPPTPARPARVR